MEEDQEPARIEIASPPGLPGALDTARAGEMARDAVIAVAAEVSADHDYGGPLARTLRHLVHLSPEQLDRVAELAWELASLLDGGATHEDPASRTYEIRHYGLSRSNAAVSTIASSVGLPAPRGALVPVESVTRLLSTSARTTARRNIDSRTFAPAMANPPATAPRPDGRGTSIYPQQPRAAR